MDSVLERNVAWEDEDGLFSIVMLGECSYLSLTYLHTNYGELKVMASFSSHEVSAGFIDSGHHDILGYGFGVAGDSIVLTNPANWTGEKRYDKQKVTLNKRSLREDEIDAKSFVRGAWANEPSSFSIGWRVTDPEAFSDTKKCAVKGEEMDFNFLGNKQFSITAGESTYAYGSYSTYLSGDFELHVEGGEGKETLGSDVYLTNSFK